MKAIRSLDDPWEVDYPYFGLWDKDNQTSYFRIIRKTIVETEQNKSVEDRAAFEVEFENGQRKVFYKESLYYLYENYKLTIKWEDIPDDIA